MEDLVLREQLDLLRKDVGAPQLMAELRKLKASPTTFGQAARKLFNRLDQVAKEISEARAAFVKMKEPGLAAALLGSTLAGKN